MPQQFDESIFRDRKILFEDSLLDFKVELKPILTQPGRKGQELPALIDLIKDIIALANTARIRGETAYYVWGITDKEHDLQGIADQSPWIMPPHNWANQDLRAQRDNCEQVISGKLQKYIDPAPSVDFYFGRYEGALVAYLQILPVDTRVPYVVAQSIIIEDNELRKGQSWQRIGSHNGPTVVEISQHDKDYLRSFRQMPFIRNGQWQQYLRQELSRPPMNPSPMPQELLKIRSASDEDVLAVIERFLLSDSPCLLIEGDPGSGKTTLLWQVWQKYAESAVVPLENQPYLHTPDRLIPLFFSLNRYRDRGQLPARLASEALPVRSLVSGYTWKGMGEDIFAHHQLRFLILLDALDEVEPNDSDFRQTTLSIDQFIADYPSCKLIITSRPGQIPPLWGQRYELMKLNALADEEIKRRLHMTLQKPDETWEFIQQNSAVYEMVRSPLLLQPVIDYWTQVEARQEEEKREQAEESDEVLIHLPEHERREGDDLDEQEDFQLMATVLEDAPEIDPPLANQTDDTEKILPDLVNIPGDTPHIGELTHHVFNALLTHDETKGLTPNYPRAKQERTIALGKLAAYLDGRYEETSYNKALSLTDDKHTFYWSLNMGILAQTENSIRFKYRLSKLYFATQHLLELINDEHDTLSITPDFFWYECLQIFEGQTFFRDVPDKIRNWLVPAQMKT